MSGVTPSQFADISSNNPLPDLAAYKAAGHKHLCRKVSEGTAYHWIAGDGVADRAHALGITVGHYHWLRPEQSATAQATYFVTLLRGHLKPGDWLMADFERTANVDDPSDVVRAAQLEQFATEVHRRLPEYPLYVYTGNWYLEGKPHCQAAVRKWPVVMSDYSAAATLPNPYRLTYAAWQFTDRASVAGFSAPVDYNRWLTAPAGHATDSGGTTALPTTPASPTPQEAQMYEVIQDHDTRHWYAYSLGVWRNLPTMALLNSAINTPLCINAKACRARHAAGYQLSHAEVLSRQSFALGK